MKRENDEYSAFREVQRVRQVWVWLIVLFLACLGWYWFVGQIIMQRAIGTRPIPGIMILIIWIIFGIVFPSFLPFTKLRTEVRDDGIFIHFFPFHWSPRRIDFAKLKSYEVRTYRPLRDYGGWGIRMGSQGLAYNMSGNHGVQLKLTNGNRVLIGSQKPDELLRSIEGQVEKSRRNA
jgi:hypothetical protein